MDLKESRILGDAVGHHWYYRSKAMAVSRALGDRYHPRAIDIGSGSGFFAHHLLRTGQTGVVDCVDPAYHWDERILLPDGKQLDRHRSLETVEPQADLALLMDVLEHVDDDRGLLADSSSKVRAGGTVLITVPAFQWMWSGHDVFLEHRRRYTLAQVERLARSVDLEVQSGHYFFGALFPVAAGQRLLDRRQRGDATSHLRDHPRLIQSVLTDICAAETRIQRWNRVAGLSVIVTARRPDAA